MNDAPSQPDNEVERLLAEYEQMKGINPILAARFAELHQLASRALTRGLGQDQAPQEQAPYDPDNSSPRQRAASLARMRR